MKKAIASVGLLAVGAAAVQCAHADMSAGADKPWTISGTLRGFYDDNYNTQPNGTNKVSSFGFELRPSASLNWSSGPTIVSGSYTYSAKYYEDRQPNKWDQSHDVELYMNHSFNERYSLDLEESFVDAQEPEVLNGMAPASAPERENGDNYRNSAGFNFHAQLTRLFGIVIGYANNWYDYTGTQADQLAGTPSYATLLNRDENDVIFNTRWQLAEQTVGILGYTFGTVDYTDNASLSTGTINAGPPVTITPGPFVSPSTRNNYSHDIYVGVEHSFRSDLTFSGRAGIQILDYYNDPSGNNTSSISPYVSLNANYTYMDGGNLIVGFSHTKNQTDQAGISVTAAGTSLTQDEESSTVSVSVNQVLTPLSPKLSASISGQYQDSSYNGGTINGEKDDFYLFGVNFTYQFTHYISAEVGYNYDLLQSDIPQRGYDRNRVYIGVTASY